MMIFTGMLLMFGAAFPTLARSSGYTSLHNQAVIVAQRRIDIIRRTEGYSGLPTQNNELDCTADDELIVKKNGSPGYFPPNARCVVRVDKENKGCKYVSVRVTWSKGPGRAAGGVALRTVVVQSPYIGS
ncbi:MAG: hypothetical protein H7Z41_13555 [Cytophagales bacterium]|nr:hypothetical protein [Armatimonadota bacterium]